MKIFPLDIDKAKSLTEFYNQQIANLPYRFPVTPQEFDWGIRHQQYEDKPYEHLHSETLFVAKEGKKIIGFIHVGIETNEENQQTGLIRFLSYQPGHRAAGQSLLTSAEDYFRQSNIKTIHAFQTQYNYRFFFIGYGVPDTWGHVLSLLQFNDYEIYRGEIFMAYPNYQIQTVPEPQKLDKLTEEEIPSRGSRPGLSIRAFLGDHQLGMCNTLSAGHFQLAPQIQDHCYVAWLHVRDEHQGKRWGDYLLQLSHQKMREKGFQHALISTNVKNHRAALFYTNHGYQVIDTSYALRKTLD